MKLPNHNILKIILLIILFGEIFSSTLGKSATFDENIFIPASYAYLRTGIMHFNAETQPLCKYLCAAPLFLLKPSMPIEADLWDVPYSWINQAIFGQKFLYVYNADKADLMILLARIPTMLVSVLLAFFIFKWARQLYGTTAGYLALAVYVFCPNMAAHSGIAYTDLFVTFFIFISVCLFWIFLNQPSKTNLIFCGIAFGLAQATKLTSLLLVPIFILTYFIYLLKEKKTVGYKFVVKVAGIFIIGLLVLNLTYRFSGTFSSKQELVNQYKNHASLKPYTYYIVEPFIYTMPLPKEYVESLFWQLEQSSQGHPSFLAGKYSDKGFWYYYIVAFLIKTPIPVLLLIVAILIFGYRSVLNNYFLYIPILVIFAAFSFSNKVNIGLRYILPVYPFIFLLVSNTANIWGKSTFKYKIFIPIILGIWYITGSLYIYPHYLAYFNELAGGPGNGYKWLVDSNLDWGQDLIGLSKYVEKHQIKKIRLSYFGLADPSYYEIPFEELPFKDTNEIYKPEAGIYAISATNLQGAYSSKHQDHEYFRRFRDLKPDEKIGYSIFVYNIP